MIHRDLETAVINLENACRDLDDAIGGTYFTDLKVRNPIKSQGVVAIGAKSYEPTKKIFYDAGGSKKLEIVLQKSSLL